MSVYDIQQSVIDKAPVPIYHESRIADLHFNEAEIPTVDSEFKDITEREKTDRKKTENQVGRHGSQGWQREATYLD